MKDLRDEDAKVKRKKTGDAHKKVKDEGTATAIGTDKKDKPEHKKVKDRYQDSRKSIYIYYYQITRSRSQFLLSTTFRKKRYFFYRWFYFSGSYSTVRGP